MGNCQQCGRYTPMVFWMEHIEHANNIFEVCGDCLYSVNWNGWKIYDDVLEEPPHHGWKIPRMQFICIS